MNKLIILSFLLVSTVTAFTQASTSKKSSNQMDTASKIVYICPMHAEVISDKPGKCPKCGMELVKKQVSKIYTCSMHPEVISDKPGKCPKCGMNLVEKKSANTTKM